MRHIRWTGFVFLLFFFSAPAYSLTDSYKETFDGMADGSTVNGVDSWAVSAGSPQDAMVESGNTSGGSGKALKLVNASTPANVSRADSYGHVSPTWVEYVVKPGLGADPRDVPTDGAAAVVFSSNGKILAADGKQWLDTGKTFSVNTWYRVILKLDFSTHLYDLYTEPASSPKSPFVPDKQSLHFIDPNLSSMGQVGFVGDYNMTAPSDSLVDEVVVHDIDRLQFTSAPQTLVKGHPSSLITVQLQNANSEPQTAWRDIEVELRSSVQNGQFSVDKNDWVPISTMIIPEGSQQISFFYMDNLEGRPSLSANEFPDRGWTDATQEQKVVSEGAFFAITATTPQVAGVPFSLQIAAMDSAGGVDSTYGGAVDVSLQYVQPSTGSRVITPNEGAGFVSGLKDLTVNYPDAGTVKIIVRDKNDPLKVGYSGEMLFLPASFDVSANPIQIVGKTFPVTIKALEKEGQIAKNYKGPSKLTAEAVSPALTTGQFNPSTLPAGSFEAGVATLNTSFNRWGLVGLKVSDEAHPEKLGTSTPIQFVPKALSVTVKPPSNSRSFFYTGESMEISVSVLGQDDFPIDNFQGTVSLTPTPSFPIPAQYTFSDADKGQKKFVVPAGSAGKYRLKAEDTQNNLNAESDEFEVKDATIVVSNTSAPVGATTVEIQLVDSHGKRIKEENEMTLTILVSEENANGSVFFSEAGKPVLFKKGIAKVVIGDAEAEVVTISAASRFGIKVVSGKVIFGKAGATGVGTLMLRESKD